MAEFQAFPKIPRLNRDIVVTEKLDGTNAAVIIEECDPKVTTGPLGPDEVSVLDWRYRVQAQSRKRLITPGKQTDNFGFAGWVRENAEELVRLLGPGRHFGEWWGQGIARNYGLDHRRFSLFNPTFDFDRMEAATTAEGEPHPLLADQTLGVVPVLYSGPFVQNSINNVVLALRRDGSKAAPGFDRPEGIMVYHTAAGQYFKVTCVGDEAPKSLQG